jgi:hypothetical protein
MKTILIIGASFGGLTLAKNLLKANDGHFSIILVDKRDYLDINFVSPRLLQEPEKVIIPLKSFSFLTKCTRVQAEVTELRPTEALLSNGEIITFNLCAICTGARNQRVCLTSNMIAFPFARCHLFQDAAAYMLLKNFVRQREPRPNPIQDQRMQTNSARQQIL